VLLKSRLGGMPLKRSDPSKELPMGKIADALERHKKEKSQKIEFLHDSKPARPMETAKDDREIALAKEVCTLYECNPKVVVLSKPESADAESFKLLRAQILFARGRQRPRTIMVTSTFPGEGKTFVAANLAAGLALSIDESVLLIDCDLRRPRVHDMFGCPNTSGLHEYLIEGKRLDDLLIQSHIEKLSLLPAGKVPRNPTEILSSKAMRTFLEHIKQRYLDRFIIIDSSPSHITAEAKVLGEYVDGVILVIMAGKSPRKDVQKAIHNLGKDRILGVVFNGYGQDTKKYYKYYKKYYRGS
jgi:exopolysaccharide/PEP-CTERM locus tyrosine autokinase